MGRKEAAVKMGERCENGGPLPRASEGPEKFAACSHYNAQRSGSFQPLVIAEPVLPAKFLLSVHVFYFFVQSKQIK